MRCLLFKSFLNVEIDILRRCTAIKLALHISENEDIVYKINGHAFSHVSTREKKISQADYLSRYALRNQGQQ